MTALQAAYHLKEIRNVLEQRGWEEGNILTWYAGVFGKGESYKVAEDYFRQAHALRPEDDYITHDLASFLIENDINLEEGMELMIPVVEKYPENASFSMLMHWACLNKANTRLPMK
jgi:hypothetical protein